MNAFEIIIYLSKQTSAVTVVTIQISK